MKQGCDDSKRLRRAAILLLLLAAPWSFAGCAWRVTAPVAPGDPVPVFLTDYGRHTRLALPADEDTMREYGFGEWHFYALGEQGPLSTLRAVFGFGEATLASRTLPSDEDLFRRRVRGSRTVRFHVEQEDAARLLEALEERWRQYPGEPVRHRETGLSFIPVDDSYHGLSNSNHRTAKWLRELGCEVRGFPILSNFRLVEPD